MMRHSLVAATVWAGLAGAAFAQGAPTPQASPIIYPTSASLAVSTVSAAGGVALPAPTLIYPAALAYNIGAAETFVALGTSSVTATASGIPIEPGQCIPLWVGQSSQRGAAPTNIAAITAAGTSTLRIVQATSLLACGGAPSAIAGPGSGGTFPTVPAPITYQGTATLSAATSTQLIAANVTMQNGSTLPLAGAFGKLFVLNTGSTNSVYVCWLGGACSPTSGGELLLPGASDTKNLSGQAAVPTFYSTSGTPLAFSN